MELITEALKKTISQFSDAIIRLDLEDEKLKAGYEKRQTASLKKATGSKKKKKP